jgi:hypothetical protein
MSLIAHSRIARARGLAQAIAGCRDDARLDGIREGAAEIAELLDLPITDRGAVEGTPEERIAAVLHSIGFGAERHELARRMLRLAQDFGGQ